MELLNGVLTNDSTTEQRQKAEKEIELRLKKFPTNQYGIKLPIGTHPGISDGEKPYLNWSKSETNQGTILSAYFNFDIKAANGTVTVIRERVNFTDFKQWQSVGKDTKITVEIKRKSATDETLVCKIISVKVNDVIPPKEGNSELPEDFNELKAIYLQRSGKPYTGEKKTKKAVKDAILAL